MTRCIGMGALCIAIGGALMAGCAAPFDMHDGAVPKAESVPEDIEPSRSSAYGTGDRADEPSGGAPELPADPAPDEYIRYALFHSPTVEAAYQRWRAAAERPAQVSVPPDPRLTVGFFADEVETRVGAQQARVGLKQTIPWPGRLGDQRGAATRAARAAWREYQQARLEVTERVVRSLHELAYLDAAIGITRENLALVRSFAEVARARYRVGTGTHPDLIRAQVELGQLEDRLSQLESMRPARAAELNAALHRPASAETPAPGELPGRVATADAERLVEMARHSNRSLLALDERAEARRLRAEVARAESIPDLTVGVDYIATAGALDGSIPESGDDPILMSFGINLPVWRGKYNAGVREANAQRLAASRDRQSRADRIDAAVHRAWFKHTDADRRARLYERTLIPKAEESVQASLASFRAGRTTFLDLLDAERTLLEFSLAAARARADRGKALARLNTLAGEPVPVRDADERDRSENGARKP